MRILIVSQYFWPETFIINDLARKLVSRGHQVTVFTGKPNYPDGELFPGYVQDGIMAEQFTPEIEVLRVPLRPRFRGGAKNLLFNYLSFVFNGLRYFPRLAKGRDFDVVFVFATSPITAAIPAILLKLLRRKPLAIWVQDLWPESLSATGFITNPLVLRIVGIMVRVIYAFANTLLIQSKKFHDPVAAYADPAKIVYYPNSIDIDAPPAPAADLPASLLDVLEGHFAVVFAGNIGKAQATPTILDAAERLRDLKDLRVVMVGSGSMLEWMKAEVARRQLDNVHFAGRFPMASMPAIYERASALLVTLTADPIIAYTVPSKIQAYLAAGRPILAALDGAGAEVVLEAGAGLSAPAEDPVALAQCIRDIYAMPPDRRAHMGDAGRAYFMRNFEMGRQADRLVEILEARMKT